MLDESGFCPSGRGRKDFRPRPASVRGSRTAMNPQSADCPAWPAALGRTAVRAVALQRTNLCRYR